MRGDVPDDKAAIIDAFLTEQGCTLGALLESFADILDETGRDPDRLIGHGARWIARAKEITAERRKRPRI
jgi:hypothetical protein